MTLLLTGPEAPDRLTAIANDDAPRLDYRVVAERVGGKVWPCAPSPSGLRGGKLSRVGRSVGGNLQAARRAIAALPVGGTLYSTGETWGLAAGLMGRRATRKPFRHVVYTHRLYTPFWQQNLGRVRPHLHVDSWICVNRVQADLLRQALGDDSAEIHVVSQGVDTHFFSPDRAEPTERRPYLLAVGTEMRDYALLFEAVAGLDVDVMVKASSSWMTQTREALTDVPSNVTVIEERLSYAALRDLYAGASAVVVPLFDTPQAAGITSIYEAMAMRKCVIATQSAGLPDPLVDGKNGVVCGSHSAELRHVVQFVLRDHTLRDRLASAGFHTARYEVSIEAHASAVSAILRSEFNPARAASTLAKQPA